MFALGTSLTIRPIYIYFQGQILDLKLIGSATSNPHRHKFFFCTGDAAVVLMPACLPAILVLLQSLQQCFGYDWLSSYLNRNKTIYSLGSIKIRRPACKLVREEGAQSPFIDPCMLPDELKCAVSYAPGCLFSRRKTN